MRKVFSFNQGSGSTLTSVKTNAGQSVTYRYREFKKVPQARKGTKHKKTVPATYVGLLKKSRIEF